MKGRRPRIHQSKRTKRRAKRARAHHDRLFFWMNHRAMQTPVSWWRERNEAVLEALKAD